MHAHHFLHTNQNDSPHFLGIEEGFCAHKPGTS
jgi:hypothetical protein